ncbi:hypothetical protein UlMin_042057, partial [Ulmus minor]
ALLAYGLSSSRLTPYALHRYGRKFCLVFDICHWHILSWFWGYYCSWNSELVDFT